SSPQNSLSQLYSTFFFSSAVDHRALHSFPTRRSSDLVTSSCSRPSTCRRRWRHSIPRVQTTSRRSESKLRQDSHQRWLSCARTRSEEHTSELQSRSDLVCRLLLEKKKEKDNPKKISHH